MKPKASKSLEAEKEGNQTSKSPKSSRESKRSLQSDPAQETVLIGKLENSEKPPVSKQYLLPLNSQAIRGVFSDKYRYNEIAQELKGELELTRIVATPKNKDWPRYTLIEVRSVDAESLAQFESRLLETNPSFAEMVPYDPYKYVCVQVTGRSSSLFVHPDNVSFNSVSDASEVENKAAEGESAGKDEKKETNKITKKPGEKEKAKRK